MTALHARAWLSLAVLFLIMGVLLFICAGTVRYWRAWIYFALFFGCPRSSRSTSCATTRRCSSVE